MSTLLDVKTRNLLPYEIALIPNAIISQSFAPDLTHTIALLSGYDGQNEHLALVDATGTLHVNAGAKAYLNYAVFTVNVGSATPSGATVSLPDYVNEIDLQISGNPINLSMLSSKTQQWQDTINLPVGSASLDYVTNALELWCSVSGGSSTIQVVAWW